MKELSSGLSGCAVLYISSQLLISVLSLGRKLLVDVLNVCFVYKKK